VEAAAGGAMRVRVKPKKDAGGKAK